MLCFCWPGKRGVNRHFFADFVQGNRGNGDDHDEFCDADADEDEDEGGNDDDDDYKANVVSGETIRALCQLAADPVVDILLYIIIIITIDGIVFVIIVIAIINSLYVVILRSQKISIVDRTQD